MSRYIVSLSRVEHRVYQIEIEADTPEKAHDIAVDTWAEGDGAFKDIGCVLAEDFINAVEEKREDAAYEYAMSSDYSYEKEEGRYQANLLISELQSNCFSADELPDRMERVRANLKKDLGDPQSFDEWDSHFTAAINKAMEAA